MYFSSTKLTSMFKMDNWAIILYATMEKLEKKITGVIGSLIGLIYTGKLVKR